MYKAEKTVYDEFGKLTKKELEIYAQFLTKHDYSIMHGWIPRQNRKT
jgi:hypothetical protein